MNENKEKYEIEITKKLDAFKTAKEWSDFITLLSSLDATIKKFPIPDIPRKKLLFKRLNQCLNPVLPAGIHNKALETYALIFEKISRESLLKDFDFLTLGLFTFSAHCRILVTNSFLDVMERHIVPLGKDIEGYSTSVLIGLLPPMEFESGEYYNRAHLITTDFKSLISPEIFYSSMWSILLNDERLRTSIVNYILSTGREDTMVANLKLTSKALCAGLNSEATLVVRGCLDLLIFIFPSKGDVGDEEIVDELVEAVVKLFIKRDLSLNKRIYSWLNLTNTFNDEDVVLLTRTLRRFLNRNTPGDIQFFFRILMTLQDKGKLCEKIMENLLFDALICLEECKSRSDAEMEYDVFEECGNENIDTEKVAKMFLTTDLDSIWKILYLKLKSNLKMHGKKKMLLESDSLEDTEFGDEIMREEMSSMHTMSLILNEGYVATEDECSNNGDKSNGDTASESNISNQEEGKKVIGSEDDAALRKMLKKNKSPKKKNILKEAEAVEKSKKIFVEEGHSLDPNQILHLVRFAIDTYSITDSEVFYHHLPFLTHLALSNFLLFEPKVLFSFLSFSIKIMKFKEEQSETTASLQKLINKFYLDENAEILDETSSIILYSISDKIGKLAEYNTALSSPLIFNFIQTHGIDVFSTDFAQNYYKLTLNSSTKLIGEHFKVYQVMDCSKLNLKDMFDVLWERFCYAERDVHLESSKRLSEYDLMGESEHGSYVYTLPLSKEDNDLESNSKSEPTYRFFRSNADEFTNHKFLAELLCKYNKVFEGGFEKLLLKKVVEGQTEEICHFLLLKIENFKDGFDFLELYYVINCKLDPDSPILDTFLCSLTCFNDLFKFLLKKLEDANIYANDFLFVDSPDLNQVLGVLKCIKNLLKYSRRFKMMLINSTKGVSSEIFSPTINLMPKEMLYKALAYLFINGGDCNGREISIEIISILRTLVKEEILTGIILNSPEIPKIIEIIKKSRDDSTIVLDIIPVIKCTGNSVAILDFCSMLDYRCFYYYSFLEFVFSLTDRLQRKVLVNVLSSLENEEFALMIIYEIMDHLLVKRGAENELPEFVSKGIRFILEFFESQYIEADGVEDASKFIEEEEPIKHKGSNSRKYLDDFQESSFQGPPSRERFSEMASNVSGAHKSPASPFLTAPSGHRKNVNPKMNTLKLKAAKSLSMLFFKKLPFRFTENILDSRPCLPFLRSIDFKEQLYISILNSHSNSPAKAFKFLTVFNQVVSTQELRMIFNKSRTVFEKISAYRVSSDYASLQFSLKILLALNLRESDEALVQSIVLSSIYFLQRRLDLKARGNDGDYKEDIGLLWVITDFKFTGALLMAVPGLITAVFTLINSNSRTLKKVGIDFLIKLSENGLEVKHWKREFLDIFHTLDFFTYRLYGKSLLMKRLVTEDPSVINDLIARLEGSFFVSQASDANNKTLVLKRISYIIFSAPFNYFAGFSLKLVEKIAILINHPSSKVKREAFFLSKMLILKIPHDKLINLYPVLFYDVGVVVENVEDSDMPLLIEVLKLLDTVFLLNTPQFSEIRLIFLDSRACSGASEELQSNEETLKKQEDFQDEADNDIPLSDLSIKDGISKKFMKRSIFYRLNCALREKHNMEVSDKLPTPVRKIPFLISKKTKVEDILSFTANASSYYNWLDESCSEIDYEFLFYLVLGELKEAV